VCIALASADDPASAPTFSVCPRIGERYPMSKDAFEFLIYGLGTKIRRFKNEPLAPGGSNRIFSAPLFGMCGEDDEIHTRTRL
jgi:hypothetical protein